MPTDVSLIALLSFSALLPFLIASGTCYVKFSIVFIMMRNAMGLQQVPSNMTLNGIALLLSLFVMAPVAQQAYDHFSRGARIDSVASLNSFADEGLSGYRNYLKKYADPDLVAFFQRAQNARQHGQDGDEDYAPRQDAEAEYDAERPSILALLPAYALSEIKSAFKIAFFLYVPFVVVDLLISSILLALGMMMMSPVTISVPVKLLLFVALDGWTLLSKGLVLQYLDVAG
ncbi:MAG TPA: EscR/YscR/HrcR family type III secretion system export apparatus protein [Herbaspirillum sp.]|jgi:type III secretion apparatus YscR/HrcR family protein|nr:EscR/YscR/HrcR family type III secretion system export apparatus protein [Herbaspirillum sp.]